MKTTEAVKVLQRLKGTVKLPEEVEAIGHALAIMERMMSKIDGHSIAVMADVMVQTPNFRPEKVAQAPLRYRENY